MLAGVQAHLGRTSTVALAALLPTAAVAVPVVYLVYLNGRIRSSTTSRAGRRSSSRQHGNHQEQQERREGSAASETRAPADPRSLPGHVRSDDGSQWVVSYERVVSKPIPASSLSRPPTTTTAADDPAAATGQEEQQQQRPSPLLRAYIRAAHVAFSWTPQALLMRAMIKEPSLKRSFDRDWIDALDFVPGDMVNGVYRASHYSKEAGSVSERSELLIEVPASYKGPPVKGLLVAAIEPAAASSTSDEEDEEAVVFVNETWMWRGVDEPPTLLESPLGGWFHGKLAGWLILKGLSTVVAGRKDKAS
ncbi:hypothetical protein JDV02_008744 [Purpureocillium takamizusanense]|uniref:Uncharacterized protein n=1 Tax=Purpureocillium takamizusanense TaxID=2060973 RepID=A0A9Q8QND3_9HYPO|nr:uncharacterized protein JDV02_008744 [Purpureocillium takamizusanense]UNI22900.1 hypothetical protein JDV02_008744 [Purpureocillium takamizusanense]